MKVYIEPKFRGEDRGDGGIRRVVEAQIEHLSKYGVSVVDSVVEADLVAVHAGNHVVTDKPIVEHCHGLYWDDYKWENWAIQLNSQVSRNIVHADAVTAPTQWVADVLKKHFWVDPVVIGHGVDPIEPGVNKGYVLWNKTRVDPVCDPAPVAKLAGMAKDVEFISTFADNASNIKTTGKLTLVRAHELISNAGVYLSTSRETFGIGTLEAMSAGVPILGWAWGGNREIVQQGVTGWLSRPGDFDDLLKGLRWCLNNRNDVGKTVVRDNYKWVDVVEKYAELYKQVYENRVKKGVTVVIPCYNLGRYIKQAVDSVRDQCDEIIIVDDASTDDSAAICNSVGVRVIHNESNQYLAASLNIGIEAASNDLVLPLDADNFMAPLSVRLLETQLRAQHCDIAYGSVRFVLEDGISIDSNVSSNGISKWPPAEFDYSKQMTFPTSLVPSTALYKKKVWQRVNGYRTRWRTAEDADFWCRATTLGFVPKKVTEAVTLNYRQREDSMSRTEQRKDWTIWYPGRGRLSIGEPTLISVVIPVGPGHENLVINALDSLWMQSFPNWEVICVLDTPNKVKLPPWVKVVEHGDLGTEPWGPACSRNKGIVRAQGKLLYFLDADDYLINKDALKIMYEAYKSDGGFVYSDWIDKEGKLHKSVDDACAAALDILPTPVNILCEHNDVRFNESLVGWEEWDFVLQLLEQGQCGTRVPMPLFKYDTTSGTRRKLAHTQRDSIVDILDERWGPYKRKEKQLACGSCGGRPKMQIVNHNGSNGVMADHTGQSQIEYLGNNPPRTFRGTITGSLYRFGIPTHRVRYVDDRDIEGILQLEDFKVYA